MSSSSKSLFAEVIYNGEKMKAVDVINAIKSLDPTIPLTTSEAAIFLRMSVTTLERLRKSGSGPTYSQPGAVGVTGSNQTCYYQRADLEAWFNGNRINSVLEASIRKGQTFGTIFDVAEPAAFYVDPEGNIESMVEENMLGTVVGRIGQWEILWMTPVEAAGRRWTDLDTHKAFAEGVRRVLSNAINALDMGVEETDIAQSMRG